MVIKYWRCLCGFMNLLLFFYAFAFQTDRRRNLHGQINSFFQELVSHSETDVNLEGDLGNTPFILAASLDNHEALLILVTKIIILG